MHKKNKALPGEDTGLTLKRHRSPKSIKRCKKFLLPGHNVQDCRHQLTCRWCSGAGHIATHCPFNSPPERANISERGNRSRSKKYSSDARPLLQVPFYTSKNTHSPLESSLLRVFLHILEEIIKSKEELKKMVVIKVIFGNASIRSLSRALPEILNSDQYGTVIPTDDNFIFVMNSTRIAFATLKRGTNSSTPLSAVARFPLDSFI